MSLMTANGSLGRIGNWPDQPEVNLAAFEGDGLDQHHDRGGGRRYEDALTRSTMRGSWPC